MEELISFLIYPKPCSCSRGWNLVNQVFLFIQRKGPLALKKNIQRSQFWKLPASNLPCFFPWKLGQFWKSN